MQVMEFLNHQDGGLMCNEWLKQMAGKIDVIDIKYSVGVFSPDADKGWDGQEFSGILVIYKQKEC